MRKISCIAPPGSDALANGEFYREWCPLARIRSFSKFMFYNLLRDDALRLDSGPELDLVAYTYLSPGKETLLHDLGAKFYHLSYIHIGRASFLMIRFYVKRVKNRG